MSTAACHTAIPQLLTALKDNGFHAGAFQRSSLKLMLLYARIFVFCASLARIQKLQPTSSNSDTKTIDRDVLNLWQSLIATIMDQMAFLINEPAYRCQLPWAPTYPALTIAFVSKSYILNQTCLHWVDVLIYKQRPLRFALHAGAQA